MQDVSMAKPCTAPPPPPIQTKNDLGMPLCGGPAGLGSGGVVCIGEQWALMFSQLHRHF